MPLKKQERKDAYIKVLSAMGKSQHKKAWELMTALTADDTGFFVMGKYEDVIEANKNKQ